MAQKKPFFFKNLDVVIVVLLLLVILFMLVTIGNPVGHIINKISLTEI